MKKVYSASYAKASATMRERYGVDHYRQLPEAKKRVAATNRDRYGFDFVLCDPEVRNLGCQIHQRNLRVKQDKWVTTVVAMHNNGDSAQEIHRVTGLSESFVCRLLRREGVDPGTGISHASGRRISRARKEQHAVFVKENAPAMIALYNEGMSMNAIGKATGHGGQVVKRVLTDSGIAVKLKNTTTFPEKQLHDYLVGSGIGDVVMHDRSVLKREGKHPLEIDAYVPSKRIGFEVNGIYWHKNDDPDRMPAKVRLAAKRGVALYILECEDKLSDSQLAFVGGVIK